MRKKIRGIMLLIMLLIMGFLVGCIRLARHLDAPSSVVEGMIYGIPFLAIGLLIVYIAIDLVIKRNMIDGLEQLNRDMMNISKGNLNVFSCVSGNPEFEQLSKGINSMVKSISRTSGMLTRVFEMLDAPFAVFEFNDDSKSVMVTDRLGSLLGITSDELGAMVQDKQLFRTRLAWIIKNPIPGEEDVYQFGSNKKRYIRINIVKDDSSTFGMVADVTDEIRTKQAIIKERDYDALTKIRNRRSFQRDVTRLLNSGDLSQAAMIMIDLDKFKGINDTYGHAFGDEYLQRAAGFISRFSEKNCIVARRSGDEFYMLVYNYPSKEAIRNLALRYYNLLQQEPIEFPDGQRKSIGMSMGIAWYRPGIKDFDAFLQCADDALYAAKEGGRNTFGEKIM